ncbi:MAG: hypothetical protein IKD76_07950, partial [Clostridia bacterium]|nr:hypothetical protein [Clostridia bacterium]
MGRMNTTKQKVGIAVSIILCILLAIGLTLARLNVKTEAIPKEELAKLLSYQQITDENAEYADENNRVIFSAFFTKDLDGDGYAEKMLGTCNYTTERPIMYINIGVKSQGYLKDGAITLKAKDGSVKNYQFSMSMLEDDVLNPSYPQEYVATDVTRINLKRINAGIHEMISGEMISSISEPDAYASIAEIVLTGTYVDEEDGIEEEINKAIDINVDWYGTAQTKISSASSTYNMENYTGDTDINVAFSVVTGTEGLLQQSNVIEAELPELYGAYPTVVGVENAENYSYNPENHILTIYNSAGTSTNRIKLKYSKDISEYLTATLAQNAEKSIYVNLKAYSNCYNNPSGEFDNPYVTEEVSTRAKIQFTSGQHFGLDFSYQACINEKDYLGNYQYGWSKEKFLDLYDAQGSQVYEYSIYASIHRERTYGDMEIVTVNAGEIPDTLENVLGEGGYYENVGSEQIVTDDGNVFIVDSDYQEREGRTGAEIKVYKLIPETNYEIVTASHDFGRYYTKDFVTIKSLYFTQTSAMKNNGYIRIYNDDTNELIKEFSNGEWVLYSSSATPYVFAGEVRQIRIETSKDDCTKAGYLSVIINKEINMDELKQQVSSREELENIANYTDGAILKAGNGVHQTDTCNLYTEKSYPELEVIQKNVTAGDVNKDVTLKINIPRSVNGNAEFLYYPWIDGTFLIKIPKEKIMKLDIQNVTSDLQYVDIDYYYCNEDANYYYIRVNTKNNRTEAVEINGEEVLETKAEKGFAITINCKASVNPISGTSSQNIELYSYNKAREMYYTEIEDVYDLDNDGITNDYVGYDNTTISVQAPSNFMATQSLTNYDSDVEVQEIYAPNTVEVKTGTRQATINVLFVNNHKSDITNLKILGKIPYEGNTYFDGVELKSTYSSVMSSEGITLPESLRNSAKVYYSENANPTDDVNDNSNNWKLKEDVESFESIKTYLIVVNSTLNKGELYRASYNVEIPEDVASNKVSFACFKASFDMYTDGGLLPLSVQPTKLGIKMVEYYDFEVKKLKEGTLHPAEGATYSLTEEDEFGNEVNQRIIKSDENGNLVQRSLIVNQTYYLREIDGGAYETDTRLIKFRVVSDNNSGLIIERLADSETFFEGDVTFRKNAENRNVLVSEIRDIPTVHLQLNKKDSKTGEGISGVSFALLKATEGKIYTTDSNGKLDIYVSANTEYTLKEVEANGYYLNEDIQFKVVGTNGSYEIESDSEVFANATVVNTEGSDYIEIDADIRNDKIATYNLQIVKVDKDRNIPLEGASFSIEEKDTGKIEYYTTNASGIINISNLCEYVAGKEVSGEYTLQEISTARGYALNNNALKFRVVKDIDNSLNVVWENEENLECVKNVTSDESNVTITISNNPLFKLIKINGENNERLPNAQFILYVLNSDNQEEDYAKDIYGEYVGSRNENGEYIITTDENGEVSLALPDGNYKVVEYSTLNGYEEKTTVEYFTIAQNSSNDEEEIHQTQPSVSKIIHINYIEDLVDLQKSCALGKTYAGYNVYLDRTLDFEDTNSYRNPMSKAYGDLNENGVVEIITEELTTRTGIGFTPINNFAGNFDGQGYEIQNIYEKVIGDSTQVLNQQYEKYAGLFGKFNGSTVRNLGVTGEYYCEYVKYAGGIVAVGGEKFENCHSDVDITINNGVYQSAVAGICSGNSSIYNTDTVSVINCYNTGNITINSEYQAYADGIAPRYVEKSYNTGNISVSAPMVFYFDSVHVAGVSGIGYKAKNCYNMGNIRIDGKSSYQGVAYGIGTYVENCYNTGNVKLIDTSSNVLDAVGAEVKNGYYLCTADITETGNTTNGIGTTISYMKTSDFINDLSRAFWKMDTENKNDGYPVLLETYNYVTEVNYIEDLVRLSVDGSKLITYDKMELKRNLDFNDNNSYRDYKDTSYGDLNRDGVIEGIKEELTKETEKGFSPISSCREFNGNNFEIRNLYMNKDNESTVALFTGATVKNLGVAGKINANNAGMVAGITTGWARNCYSDININVNNADGTVYVYGVSREGLFNYNLGDINVETQSSTSVLVCGVGNSANFSYNRGNINVETTYTNTAEVYGIAKNSSNSYTTGNVNVEGTVATLKVSATGETSTNSYYSQDCVITADSVISNGIVKTSEYMKQNDFVTDLKARYWKIDANENDGYPIFKDESSIRVSQINYIEDLVNLSLDVSYAIDYNGETVRLMRDLDFQDVNSYKNANDTSYGDINGNGVVESLITELTTGKGFNPIGYDNYYFRGTFDGQEHTISNLYVIGRDSSGLFGRVDSANIMNVTVTGTIYGSTYTGLCAKVVGNTLIENCTSYCGISPDGTNNHEYSGGIVGSYGNSSGSATTLTIRECKNYGDIKGYRVAGIISEVYYNVNLVDCENYGKIEGTGSDSTGGLVGYSQSGVLLNINNCHNYNEIIAQEGGTSNAVGGLIGKMYSGIANITNSGNEAKITSNRYYVGGLIGDCQNCRATINNCYNTGNFDLTASRYVGGLVAESYSQIFINDSYNAGNIMNTGTTSGTVEIGGILGDCQSGGTINNSYNSGNITSNIATNTVVGGIFGRGAVSISNTYNTGNIEITQTTSTYVGGIAGQANSTSYCYNTGNIDVTSTGSTYVGGALGSTYTSSSGNNVMYSYNTGRIDVNAGGYLYAGGIAGNAQGISYSYNKNKINATSSSNTNYLGGIVGTCSGSVVRCYNTDAVMLQTNTAYSNSSYIGGVAGNASAVVGSHNIGNVTNSGNCGSGSYLYLGGIVGNTNGSAVLSYNTAKVSNSMSSSGINCYIGGIVGTGAIQNTYNTGNISNNMTTNGDATVYVGGLAGNLRSGSNVYSYNTGKVNNNVADVSGTLTSKVGPISGNFDSNGTYQFLVYPKDLEVTGDNINYENSTAKIDEYMRSVGMYNTIKQGAPNDWKQISNQYPVLDLPVLLSETNVTEVTVENTPLEYNITTEISKNSEGARAGGTITGTEDGYSYVKTVETVAYGGTSTRAIEITPADEYDIVEIKINGEKYDYNKTRSNSVVIPVGYFNNVTQDYHVEATFEKISNILKINKVDSQTGEPVKDAVFDIQEIDTRPEVTNAIGTLVNNGEEYAEADLSKSANDLLGPVTHNSSPSYYFAKQADGTYVSNNTANTATIAESYAKIDLSGKTGSYTLEVSMTASSYYYGYAKITENTTSLTSSTAGSGYFIRINGNRTTTQSVELEAGRVYYVHFAHNRTGTGSNSSYQNKITINSINLYENSTYVPHFELEDGKYVSKEVDNHSASKYATSYIPIDLTGYTGKYNVTINAEKSSKGTGYVIFNQSSNRITSGSNAIAIASGEKDYTQVLQGGAMYYMHLSYLPTVNTDGNEMKINSIQFSRNEDDLYSVSGLKTDSKGQIATGVHYGTYNIVETEAPIAYILNETPVVYEVNESSTNQVDIQNEPLKVVVAHYYVNGTGAEFGNDPVKVAEDEYLYGMEGERYTTKVYPTIGNYELVKENNLPAIPDNALGNFGTETINVYYYYEIPTAFGSYKLNITKLREDDRSVAVEGAEFDVYEKRNGSLVRVGKLEDNGNGLYTTDYIAIQEEGNLQLVIKETVVPEGYEKMDDLNVSLNIVNRQNVYVVESTSIGYVEMTSESGRNIISGEINEPLKTLKYEVHYFEDGVECEELKETNLTAKYGSVINSYPNKLPRGYSFDTAKALDEDGNEVDLPLTIGLDEEKNIINVYYNKIRSSFKFEVTKVNSADNSLAVEGAEFEVYSVDGENEVKIGTISDDGNGQYSSENMEVSEEGTVNIKIKESVTPTEYKKVDDIVGTISFELDEENQVYVIGSTSLGIVSVADENSNNNVIRMTIEEPYDDFAYTVHYFYDGTEDESKKVEDTALFGSTITEVPDKNIEGYKEDRIETLPLTITATEDDNVVNVY